MSSSEVFGQRSNFSHRCNRLSQYLKEKGSFGDLSLGLNRAFVPNEMKQRATMDLLPMIEKSGQKSPMNLFPTNDEVKIDTRGVGSEKAQLTIFYDGQVVVFNDFPEEKAKEIMLLASNGAGTTSAAPKLPESSAAVPCFGNQIQSLLQPTIASDLPIARRASLTRFLEKRKDRIVSKGPYQMNRASSSYSSAEESKRWLGLSASGDFNVKLEH